MNIAIIGAGRIGTTFAFHLARGGHDITLIARGKRLEELQRDGLIESVTGDKATVKAASALDVSVPVDLVLVTVLAHQVEPIVADLKASAAKAVMFMFNTFEPTERLRTMIGSTRTFFAFPTVTAFFVNGKLKSTVKGPGMNTTLNSPEWAETFSKAGIPSSYEKDMDSFLRSHVAAVVPMMAVGLLAWSHKRGVTWNEAAVHVRALKEGLSVVRGLGHSLIPSFVGLMAAMPSVFITALFWAASRASMVSDLGSFGPVEAQQLIDAMAAAAPGKTPNLLAIRPR